MTRSLSYSGLPYRRHGVSLVETVVSMMLISLALLLIGKIMFQITRVQGKMAEERLIEDAWCRLSLDLRRDAHASMQAMTPREAARGEAARGEAKVLVRFEQPEQTLVEYRATDDGVMRIQRRHDRVVHQERYRVGSGRWLEASLLATPSKADRDRADSTKPDVASSADSGAARWVKFTGGDTTPLGERQEKWRIMAALPERRRAGRPRAGRRGARGLRGRPRSVRGVILAAALIALLIISLFSALLVRRAYLARHQSRMASWRAQASWVVESMLRRAELRGRPSGQPESLTLLVPTASGEERWEVLTTWKAVSGETSTWDLEVTARLGDSRRPTVSDRGERRVTLAEVAEQKKE